MNAEGAKIFQRYSLALIKVSEDKLLRCTKIPEVERTLHGSSKVDLSNLCFCQIYFDRFNCNFTEHGSIDELNELTKTAFRFSFGSTHESIEWVS